ncbi:MAG: hypothetical protein Q7U57_09720 [Methylovulum sp.]|nr:hypothetical protein [Methylovulum sp.]
MKIKLTQTIIVPAGVALRLTDAQMAARSHVLETDEKNKGVFIPVEALQFKAGETIDVVGDLPKGLLPIYDLAVRDKKGKPPKAKKLPSVQAEDTVEGGQDEAGGEQ